MKLRWITVTQGRKFWVPKQNSSWNPCGSGTPTAMNPTWLKWPTWGAASCSPTTQNGSTHRYTMDSFKQPVTRWVSCSSRGLSSTKHRMSTRPRSSNWVPLNTLTSRVSLPIIGSTSRSLGRSIPASRWTLKSWPRRTTAMHWCWTLCLKCRQCSSLFHTIFWIYRHVY